MAAYHRVHDQVTCWVTAKKPGSGASSTCSRVREYFYIPLNLLMSMAHPAMGGATIGSGGYKYPPLSKVYPPPGGYRGYKLVAHKCYGIIQKQCP